MACNNLISNQGLTMKNKADLAKLVIPSLIIANGVAYLGNVKEADNKITIEDALPIGAPQVIEASHLDDYLVAAFSEKLTSTTIGASSAWSATALDDDLSLSWDIAQLKMAQAIDKTPVEAVISYFKSKK